MHLCLFLFRNFSFMFAGLFICASGWRRWRRQSTSLPPSFFLFIDLEMAFPPPGCGGVTVMFLLFRSDGTEFVACMNSYFIWCISVFV